MRLGWVNMKREQGTNMRGWRRSKCAVGGVVVLAASCLTGSMMSLGTDLAGAAVPPSFVEGFSKIVDRVTPAVVNIAVTAERSRAPGGGPLPPGPFGGPPGPTPPPAPGRPSQSAGSGVIVSPEGFIVTNNHVVENAAEITVTLHDRREFSAKVIGTDPKSDLAVIKIEAKKLPHLEWAQHERLKVGDVVLAFGSPFGLSSTVTLGIISAMGRGNVGIADYEDFIQTDAAINPGNSGGALVNLEGRLIGINTAIFSRTGGSEGIGFAIPGSIAIDIVDSLTKSGRVVRGWMGIAIQEVTPALAKSFKLPANKRGVLISDVNEQGPSAKAGLQRGDVIVGFDDEPIENVSQLRNVVARTKVGHDSKVKVVREGKEKMVVIRIGERPPDEMLARREPVPPQPAEEEKKPDNVLASLRVQALDQEIMGQLNIPGNTSGVVINHVEPGSAAEAAGLQRGDVIQEVNHKVIKSLEDYRQISAQIKKEEMAVLLLSRQGNNLFVAVNPK